ncbi:FG-GAP-like repeat-containing protein [Micromonospora sp. NPDC048830]|uniref:C40 family peptidase n=1 Tax=Micromonospora sp. NPDC048830 TaxID=3364257 RepID=UPI0037188C11
MPTNLLLSLLLAGNVTGAPVAASAAPGTPLTDVTALTGEPAPGNPPLREYPALEPEATSTAVSTTPVPCDDNGADKAVTRTEAVTRARSWLMVGGVPYSQSRCYRNQYGDYRTDCSGFVAMAWGLGGSGSAFWTGNLDTRSHTIARSDLKPGDALLRHTGDPSENHVALFVRWSDAAHTAPVVIEQTGSADTIERGWSASYASLYTPVRYDKIVDSVVAPDLFGVSGDFTGDGKDDVIARSGSGELWLYPGTGQAITDQVLTYRVRVGVGWDFLNLVISGDFTGDGKSDIVARSGSGELWLYPGTGKAITDQVLTYRVRIGTGWDWMDAITAGDFTADGVSDLVGRTPDGQLWLYAGTGSATQDNVVRPKIRIGTDWNIMAGLTTGDFTRDGKDDVVARDHNGVLWLYAGTGNAITDQVLTYRVRIGTGWDWMDAITAGDFTADGVSDLVGRTPDGQLWLYAGTGSATQDNVVRPKIRIGTGWNMMNVIT